MIAVSTGLVAIRIVGGVFGLVLLVNALRRYRRRDVSRLNLILTGAVSLAIIVLAIFPAPIKFLLDTFGFKPGHQQQLVAAMVFAIFILFALVLRASSNTDQNAATLRLLIEALTVQAFDSSQAENLPPGDKLIVVMPAHNEADNVGAVLASMPRIVEGLPVATLVVNDASEDATSEAARKEGAMAV